MKRPEEITINFKDLNVLNRTIVGNAAYNCTKAHLDLTFESDLKSFWLYLNSPSRQLVIKHLSAHIDMGKIGTPQQWKALLNWCIENKEKPVQTTSSCVLPVVNTVWINEKPKAEVA